jgi:hypothetical protein
MVQKRPKSGNRRRSRACPLLDRFFLNWFPEIK